MSVDFGSVNTTVNCPRCGKALKKETGKNQYNCENEHCPVLFVRSPTNPYKRKVVFESSVSQATIRKVEEAAAHEILLIRSARI
jgi:NAD-dependent DNA ligase